VKIAEGREAEIFAWGERELLRLYRDAGAGATADREMSALRAVRASLPNAPAAHRRLDWDGRPGIVMERLAGRGLFAEIQRRPWRVIALGRLSGRVHAQINAVRAPTQLPDLRADLRQRIESEPEIPSDIRRAACDALADLPDGDALCHGDFHADNILLCATGPVVIDWPHATRGDPCGDFARSCLMVRLGALPPGTPALIRWVHWSGRGMFLRAYVAGYEEIRRYDGAAIRRWQLVRAVDRIADRIPGERAGLLREAERLRRRAPTRS
jgi:aminoglycoside phosphotransferase (APT) family kinase protein